MLEITFDGKILKSRGKGFSVFIPSRLTQEADKLKVIGMIQGQVDHVVEAVERRYQRTADIVLGSVIVDAVKTLSHIYTIDEGLPILGGDLDILGEILSELGCYSDTYASSLLKFAPGGWKGHQYVNPCLSQNWIPVFKELAVRTLDHLLKQYPILKGTEMVDGTKTYGEAAAREKLVDFVKFLQNVVDGKIVTSPTTGGSYLSTWREFEDQLFLLDKSARPMATQLLVDIVREYNTIFETLLKGLPGMPESISELFRRKYGSETRLLASILVDLRFGAVRFETSGRLRPFHDLIIQAIVEKLFKRPTISKDVGILAKCNGMELIGRPVEHDGYVYFELAYTRNMDYRVLCRVNKAAMTLVRDGVQVFVDTSTGKRTADLTMVEKAIRDSSIPVLLSKCKSVRDCRLIFDLIANAGANLLAPPVPLDQIPGPS